MAKLLKFFIYSNLLISFCALAFVHTGVQLLHSGLLPVKAQVLLFSATFLVYNLNIFLVHLIKGKREPKGKKITWFYRNRKLMGLLLGLNAAGLLWAFPYYSWEQSLFFIHLGVISILYNVPDRYAQTRFRSVRTVPLVKIFLIAYVWAALGAFYPTFLVEVRWEEPLLLFGLFFVFIVAITLPFDIRDYYGDKRASLLTVPGLLGIKATKGVAILLVLVYSLGLIVLFQELLAAGVLFIIASSLILGSSSKSPEWYYTGIIDSLLILHFFLVY